MEVLEFNRPRALLQFAGRAILDEVKERRHRWTWEYFAARRDDRKAYVECFRKKLLESATPEVRTMYSHSVTLFVSGTWSGTATTEGWLSHRCLTVLLLAICSLLIGVFQFG